MTIQGLVSQKEAQLALFEKHKLNPSQIPEHIAIVMDGNGRWAKAQNKARTYGHKEGAKALRRAIQSCVKLNIHYLSVYAFSTENWKRPKAEVGFLMSFFEDLIEKEMEELHKNGVRVKIKGDKTPFNKTLLKRIQKIEKLTEKNTVIQVNLMINYGSRNEITHAIKQIAEKIEDKALKSKDITEDLVSQHLYTYDCPDPEIFLRTSGEYRISNFLLWQISYSELLFTHKHWPEFDFEDLIDVLQNYQKRQRRYGAV